MTKYYIGNATDSQIRYKSSSGGIGTVLTKYLLSLPDYGTGITFVFDQKSCMYIPKLIYSAEDINICGSIYQDINLIEFIRNNIKNIRKGIVLTCAPCHVMAIRQLLNKHKIKSFILSFSCSGQTTVEGTWCFYRFIGVKKENVLHMQYRGNGWPSGIQIQTIKNRTLFFMNYTEPWVTIQRSWLFRPRRCFYCKRDTGNAADIALADPWLKNYLENDGIGSTLFSVNTHYGDIILDELVKRELIKYIQVSYNDYAIAQKPNILKEQRLCIQKSYYEKLDKVVHNRLYSRWATLSLNNMRIHNRLFLYFHKMYNIKRMYSTMFRKLRGMNVRLKTYFISRKLGGCKKGVTIFENVIINNPQSIFIGNKVGIGPNTFLGPVVEYAGIVYNPKIIIGDGTWVGKNCSIAAITKVEIGKNVLFAGHVHITDHSHGYEDILKPIASQPLITKGPVIIEDNCWLGFGCEILSGVHIGEHCVVAARAVVTKDVPAYCIVAGNPARIVKQYNFQTKEWEK